MRRYTARSIPLRQDLDRAIRAADATDVNESAENLAAALHDMVMKARRGEYTAVVSTGPMRGDADLDMYYPSDLLGS